MRLAVTSPRALEAFRALAARAGVEVVEAPMAVLKPAPLDAEAVVRALEEADLVVFASGHAAYRAAEALGPLRDAASRLLAKAVVATAEGRKGAVMVKNAFGVEPQVVSDTVEGLSLPGCRRAAVFHYGWRDPELLAKVACPAAEFQPYVAEPPPREAVERVLSADAVVFTSALAVRYFAEVGGAEAVERLKGLIVVAAGPGVSKALAELGVPHKTAPQGRIGPLAEYAISLLLSRG
ncbi:uroporphyrinogen-III synthase [Pyrobaculum neutrophilum]|uniref:Uroporphyrinogen III synthase HEM4 n=1 Tax=Pyrobaculum neutrophilum (strain DSM 2338 / JCM 9278 / NBRC 100436 / V24Sta) TaxID=444157 RepID=B1YBA8_PYRNV|nr:uroporphyrinogen-III synthase [Pyrobaculum neutrophilum]ACB39239.1 Uroporphyrinogen III synthase HEM4 [Pyrobaculum neutrophilum V24Sta]